MSNSWWGGSQIDNAMSFINSGSLVGNPITVSGSNYKGCIDSSNCGSGWACVGGVCVQRDTGAGGRNESGDTSGCGGGGAGGGGGGGCGPSTASNTTESFFAGELWVKEGQEDLQAAVKNAASGSTTGFTDYSFDTATSSISVTNPSTGCTISGCGGGLIGEGPNGGVSCCGRGRCCRTLGGGRGVQCFCGNCPPPPSDCSRFCTDYLKSNGELGEGCNDGNSCDECSSCEPVIGESGSTCVPSGGPCYCGGSSGCEGACSVCSEDGTCDEDCSTCQRCYTKFATCDCGSFTIKCCFSACPDANGQTKGFPDCQPDCDNLCPPNPPGGSGDPCEGKCRFTTICDDSPPPCPPKSTCTTVGNLFGGGRNCTIVKTCDKSNIPDSCRECDCSCEQDCPECQTCDTATGKCVRDPLCEDKKTYVRATAFSTSSNGYSYSYGTPQLALDLGKGETLGVARSGSDCNSGVIFCSNSPPGYLSLIHI